MTLEELRAWLRLLLAPGVGRVTLRRLLGAYGLPQSVLEQSPTALRQYASAAQVSALTTLPANFDAQLSHTWNWLQAEPAQRAILTLGDDSYPASLLNMPDPPVLLFAQGRVDVVFDSADGLAVVGSRHPSPQGQLNAQQFSKELAQAGWTVVSGLASGVDAAAHQSAVQHYQGQGLSTIAVVGTGLDRVYPRSHAPLAHQIAQSGLLISEYALGTPPLAAHFPMRNRLIAGLSGATLVVEAAPDSGSLITAKLAAEQGKEVFAIPGSIHTPQARGCNALIREGAQLVQCVQDILDALPQHLRCTTTIQKQAKILGTNNDDNATPCSDPMLEWLGCEAWTLDDLQARSGLPTANLQARLMVLELENRIVRLPGGLIQKMLRA